jgi:hypothetical protein
MTTEPPTDSWDEPLFRDDSEGLPVPTEAWWKGPGRVIEPPNDPLATLSPELRELVIKACVWRSEWSEEAELELADAIDAWTAMYA